MGVELLGLRQPLALAQFKPALAINPDIQARYEANRLRVIRQLRYSVHKSEGSRALYLNKGAPAKLPAMEPGSGSVQDKEKARLAEIIAKVNDLLEGDLSDEDRLVYVNNVIKGKLLESQVLAQQANNNTKEQFSNSPDLAHELLGAIMDALEAHSTMSRQALDSIKIRNGMRDVLLGPGQLYEALRARD
jgi:type I restriction enzyme R subunit